MGPFTLAAEEGLTLLTGPSGAGKSTILRSLAGIIPHVQPADVHGGVRVGGVRPGQLDAKARPGHVGWVPQDLTTATNTPWEEVALPLEHAGWTPGDTAARVEELLGTFALYDAAHRPIAHLSGGQQARVVLAAALAARPRVLALDEPLSQLDADGRRRFQTALGGVLGPDVSALAATHRPDLWTLAHRRVDLGSGDVQTDEPIPPADVGDRVVDAVGVSPRGRDIGPFDFTVDAGEAVVVQGENAVGKSSLLWCLAGILATDGGRVRISGSDPAKLRPRQRAARIGLSFQDPAWHVTQDTVWEEATLTLRILGRDPQAATRWLARFGLLHLVDRHPWDLSGGQRQRLAVVTALAHEPAVALLDEPTRGMDGRHRSALRQSIVERGARGLATVLVTHDAALAAAAPRTLTLGAAS